ncbi:MAG: DUF3459 domain-containing protein [Sinobacteraceae bacterium]|nr:DUF3459 domain-containing protein [Nevskiaceae bacterium]
MDSAHAVGIGVILDVVYNHVGPDGNYLPHFSPDYFTDRYPNEWGKSFNFELAHGCGARELVLENASYWVREFQLDGLRLDATQSICDASRPHVLAQLATSVRAAAAPRRIILVAENEPQHCELLQPVSAGGYDLDAIWNDDFHHSIRVALTGSHDGYLHDYRGRAQEFVSLAKYGFLFQGQHYFWQGKQRGTPALQQAAARFVNYIQNHDQVANTLCGLRVHNVTSPGRYRVATALLLLAPQNPLLFMGQEFCASAPFPFFADCKEELADGVGKGRRSFLQQFSQFASPQAQARVPDPCDPATFESAKLSFWERRSNQHSYALHRELLRLRAQDPVISQSSLHSFDGAVLGERAAVLRWFDADSGDRLLLINFGEQLELRPVPEPLLAAPAHRQWHLLFSTDDTRYGGLGARAPLHEGTWTIPPECAVLLHAQCAST